MHHHHPTTVGIIHLHPITPTILLLRHQAWNKSTVVVAWAARVRKACTIITHRLLRRTATRPNTTMLPILPRVRSNLPAATEIIHRSTDLIFNPSLHPASATITRIAEVAREELATKVV
jgi:hypothetical protein